MIVSPGDERSAPRWVEDASLFYLGSKSRTLGLDILHWENGWETALFPYWRTTSQRTTTIGRKEGRRKWGAGNINKPPRSLNLLLSDFAPDAKPRVGLEISPSGKFHQWLWN